jgi:MFS family permease
VSAPRQWLVHATIALGASLAPLDSAVNVGFPAITAAFAQPVENIRWVVIVYVLTYASLLLGFGRLADLFGHRRVFLAGIAWCLGALTLCSLAADFQTLLAARVAQGVGSALVLATGPALVTLSLPPEQRTRGVGVYTFAFAAAATLGPIAGGALVQLFGWSAVFWFRIPVALVALVMTLALVPAAPRGAGGARLDPVTGLALAAGLAALLLAFAQGGHFGWSSALTLGLAAGGIALLALFVRRQRDPERQVIDLALFRGRAFAVANACHVLLNAAIFMVMLFVPFYLTRSYGDSGGMLLALAPLGYALGAPIATRVLARHAPDTVAIGGLALSALALAAIALWPERAAPAWIAAVLLAQGIGYGLFQVVVMDRVMGTLSRAHQGVAGSLNMVTRTVGVVLGASAGSALFTALTAQGFMVAFSGVFHAAWVLNALALVLMAGAGRLRRAI